MMEVEYPSPTVRGPQQPISNSGKPPHHPSELDHDLGDRLPGSVTLSSWTTFTHGKWHYFTVRGHLKDAVLGCLDGGSNIYAWLNNAWHDDEVAVLREAQLPEHTITSFTQGDVAPVCGVKINHLSLFPDWQPEERTAEEAAASNWQIKGHTPPANGSRWLVNFTMFANTDDPSYESAALMLGCLPGSNRPGVKIWVWSSRGYGNHDQSQTTSAAFSGGPIHTFTHGADHATLTGDEARTFLNHLQKHDEVQFSMPMEDGSLLATFNLRHDPLDDYSVQMLNDACYSNSGSDGIVIGGDSSNSQPSRAHGGSGFTTFEAQPGQKMQLTCSGHSPNSWEVLIWEDWPGKAIGFPRERRVLKAGPWVVYVGTQPFTFQIGQHSDDDGDRISYPTHGPGTEAALHGEDARAFFYALVKYGGFVAHLPTVDGNRMLNFDLTELSEPDHWHTKACG